jgi:uncharacterized membrane protein
MKRRLFTMTAMLVLLTAWILRLHELDKAGLWGDESYTAFVAGLPSHLSQPPAEWEHGLMWWSTMDFMPPLYYAVQAGWLPLAGNSEFALRFLSVAAGTLLVALLMRLGRVLFKPPLLAALVAGALAAASPVLVWHARDARMYAMQSVFTTAGTLLLFLGLRAPQRKRLWWGVALVDALALYTHTMSALVIAYHLYVATVYLGRAIVKERTQWPAIWRLPQARALWAVVGTGVAWLPWVAYAVLRGYNNASASYWPSVIDWRFTFRQTFSGLVTGYAFPGPLAATATLLWLAVLAGGMLLVLVSARRPIERRLETILFVLFQFVLPVGTMAWILQRTSIGKYAVRYLAAAVPPLFLLPAAAVAIMGTWRTRRPWLHWMTRAAAVLMAVALLAIAGVGLDATYAGPIMSDFRAAVAHVEAKRQPDEVVLLVPASLFPAWQYYSPADWYGLNPTPTIDVDGVLHYENAVADLNAMLFERQMPPSGVWVLSWQDMLRVNDPTRLASYLLNRVGHPTEQVQITDLIVQHYTITATAPLPPTPNVSAPIRDTLSKVPLRLEGCRLPKHIAADAPLAFPCFWSATADGLPRDLNVSLRLVDEDHTEWARADSAISPGIDANRWPQQAPMLGQYRMQPPPAIPPGSYEVQAKVYGGWGGDTLSLGTVNIQRPQQATTWEALGFLADLPRRDDALGPLAVEALRVSPQTARPGDVVTVEAVWRVLAPLAGDVAVALGDQAPVTITAGYAHQWQPGDRYHTITHLPVAEQTQEAKETLPVTLSHAGAAMTLAHVSVPARLFAVPNAATPAAYHLGDEIKLAGYEVATRQEEEATVLDLTLYWQSMAPAAENYVVFVHALGAGETPVIYAQADRQPVDGLRPTSEWVAGEVVADHYTLPLSTAPTEPFDVMVGMYRWPSLERLPVTGPAAEVVPNGAAPLCTLPASAP